MVTVHDITRRPHSYRNYDPAEFVDALATGSTRLGLRGALGRIEAGRLESMVAATSKMFFRLDADEKETFTRRNPDLVQWMIVYNRLEEFNPYEDYDEMAQAQLSGENRTIPAHVDVPVFSRSAVAAGRTLREDLSRRRRSYRGFTPQEFMEVAEQHGKLAGREALARVEAGRFEPMLYAAHRFFAPLDPDERRLFARRNPGIMSWVSAWGFLEDQIYGDQLFPLSNISFPLVPEEAERAEYPIPVEEQDELDEETKIPWNQAQASHAKMVHSLSTSYEGANPDEPLIGAGLRAMTRQKTNVVVRTVQEAESLLYELDQYIHPYGINPPEGAGTQPYERVRDELETALDRQGYRVERHDIGQPSVTPER